MKELISEHKCEYPHPCHECQEECGIVRIYKDTSLNKRFNDIDVDTEFNMTMTVTCKCYKEVTAHSISLSDIDLLSTKNEVKLHLLHKALEMFYSPKFSDVEQAAWCMSDTETGESDNELLDLIFRDESKAACGKMVNLIIRGKQVKCPYCDEGHFTVKKGVYGFFAHCDNECGVTFGREFVTTKRRFSSYHSTYDDS
jgi:hypothetical protein